MDAASKQKIFAVRNQVKARHTDQGTLWDSTGQMYKDHEDVTEGVEIDFSDMCAPETPRSSLERPLEVGSPVQAGMESYRARLVGADAEVCLKAVMELLAMHNSQAAETIIYALPDSPHQGTLGTAIGMLGAGVVVDPLLAALQDEDARLRAVSALLLGIFPDARAVEPLTAALEDENEEVRTKARKSLEGINNSVETVK